MRDPNHLRKEAADLLKKAEGIQLEIEAAKDMAAEALEAKVAEINALIARAEGLRAEAQRIEKLSTAIAVSTAPIRGRVEPDDISSAPTPLVPAVPRDREAERRGGFAHVGEFGLAVMHAAQPGGHFDPRLGGLRAAASGLSQGVGGDGGFLIPPAFSTEIWDGLAKEPDNLMALCDQKQVDGESLTFPGNGETSRAGGILYGGVEARWKGEAAQMTHTGPKVRQVTLRPQELYVLTFATDKSLRNSAGALESWLRKAAIAAINWKVNDAIINGNGSAKPLGILYSPALVSVAKESGQAADTFLQDNIAKMWGRLHPNCQLRAVWLCNQDVTPQLLRMYTRVLNNAGSETVGGFSANLVNFGPGGFTIMGRPVLFIEHCKTIGDKGDVILADLNVGYSIGLKPGPSGGIRSDTSIHLRFDYAETAFRFEFEVDGQPNLLSALTPANGANTLSTFVTLDDRA